MPRAKPARRHWLLILSFRCSATQYFPCQQDKKPALPSPERVRLQKSKASRSYQARWGNPKTGSRKFKERDRV